VREGCGDRFGQLVKLGYSREAFEEERTDTDEGHGWGENGMWFRDMVEICPKPSGISGKALEKKGCGPWDEVDGSAITQHHLRLESRS